MLLGLLFDIYWIIAFINKFSGSAHDIDTTHQIHWTDLKKNIPIFTFNSFSLLLNLIVSENLSECLNH